MHEFDRKVEEKIGEMLEEINKKEKRVKTPKTKIYKKLESRIKRLLAKNQGVNSNNVKEYRELVREKRQAKRKMLHTQYINRKKKLLTDILMTEFKLELSDKKTKITDLNKEFAFFLGFTFKNTPSIVQTRERKDRKKFDARTTLGPKIGIDHARVMKRLEENQVITKKKAKKKKTKDKTCGKL